MAFSIWWLRRRALNTTSRWDELAAAADRFRETSSSLCPNNDSDTLTVFPTLLAGNWMMRSVGCGGFTEMWRLRDVTVEAIHTWVLTATYPSRAYVYRNAPYPIVEGSGAAEGFDFSQ